jgi:hypothetical protein
MGVLATGLLSTASPLSPMGHFGFHLAPSQRMAGFSSPRPSDPWLFSSMGGEPQGQGTCIELALLGSAM